MEKSINIFTNSLETNEKTLRAFAAIKGNELKKLDKLIADSKKNLTEPEFDDDRNDVIEFSKANRLDLQDKAILTPPIATQFPNDRPQHPYELDVLAAAIYYATEENQDAFDKLLDYTKIAIIKDESKFKNVISDAFWIAARYGKLKIIEKLIPEKPELKNLLRWYIPKLPTQSVSQLPNSITTPVQPPEIQTATVIGHPANFVTQHNHNINNINNINNGIYQINCDAFQIAVVTNNIELIKVLLFFNFPCNNVAVSLYSPNGRSEHQGFSTPVQDYVQRNTALGFTKHIRNKELENILSRTIHLQDAKQAFVNKNHPLATSCFSLACAFDTADFKKLPETTDSKDLWLEKLSFIIEYLHTQVENAVDQNFKFNGDLQDYRFVLDFIKIFVNLFSTNNDPNFELLYKEFLKDVIEPLYAYDCSANNTKFKLFESEATKEAFFNKHSFLSESSFSKTHGEMQGTYSVNTNIGFFTVAAQNNPQPNNNANDSVINVQTPANKTL